MTVGRLKELLKDVKDDVQVLIPMTQEFDGAFYSPCSQDSGVSQICTAMDLTQEDIEEMELLNKPIPEEDAFLLIPCGFDEAKDHSHEMN
jgi:hypothetical protein